MGQLPSQQTKLREEELSIFLGRTFLTREEILELYDRFENLGGSFYHPVRRISDLTFASIPELEHNPFRFRIAEVFCSSREPQGPIELSFDDFLHFFNAFSARPSMFGSYIHSDWNDLKIYWAFRIFDFDNDNMLSVEDIENVIRLATSDRLSASEVTAAAQAVVKEGDVDGTGNLSRTEFKRIMARIPDFSHHFTVDIAKAPPQQPIAK
eukprot:TRINITY_DN1605_c0_g2_i2.p1 TRINITY_DN1605_c0_g2~~TRINITY_DN1605_c0_g2_i2.p1  ORF type:complete len:210 (+),score=14.12 TRINITY_DN1605_c0_g2_i2:73-702(+)